MLLISFVLFSVMFVFSVGLYSGLFYSFHVFCFVLFYASCFFVGIESVLLVSCYFGLFCYILCHLGLFRWLVFYSILFDWFHFSLVCFVGLLFLFDIIILVSFYFGFFCSSLCFLVCFVCLYPILVCAISFFRVWFVLSYSMSFGVAPLACILFYVLYWFYMLLICSVLVYVILVCFVGLYCTLCYSISFFRFWFVPFYIIWCLFCWPLF